MTPSNPTRPRLVVAGTIAYDTVHTVHGHAEEVLGGSASYFALAAALFAPVGIVSVVGEDFREEHLQVFRDHGIDVTGIQSRPGRTFRWHGKYSADLSEAHTLRTELNVLAAFEPRIPDAYRSADILFLANLDPVQQLQILDQFPQRPRLVAADTMNYWIEQRPDDLAHLLKRVDLLLINEGEARLLSGEHNVVRAAARIQAMGRFDLVIKRGGYGAILFRDSEIFAIPSYPLEEVVDTTGAGDSFAGGFLGSLAYEPTRIRKALIMGNLVASFTVESFSVDRLAALSRNELRTRYLAFRDIVRLDDL